MKEQNEKNPETLGIGKDVYLRIDVAVKRSGKSRHCLYRYLRYDYVGTTMRFFKRGVIYIHAGDLMKFKPLPTGKAGHGGRKAVEKKAAAKRRKAVAG